MARIDPLTPPYASDVQHGFDAIMKGAEPLLLFRTLATSQRAWQRFRAGSLLDKGPLSLRDREIIIDRTTALCSCEYEWGVHATLFAEKARLSAEQVAATRLGTSEESCWSESERALLGAVDALHARATLSDEEFSRLRSHYDPSEILEIILLCGFYRTVSYLANGLALPPESWAARFPAP